MNTTPLGPGIEFDRIRAIASAVQDVLGPIGNDTAPIPAGVGQLVVSTDASVENVHFRRPWLTAEEIGWRAAISALSDLAAAGAKPAGLTVALTIPASATEHQIVDLMRGVAGALRTTGGLLLGGDLSAGPCWSVTVTVFGHVERPVGRGGARVGDRIWVTGMLGGARAAVESWLHGIEPIAPARLSFARPQARIASGRYLAQHGATAMIDLSDGLAGDAGHLAAASDVGIAIDLDALPVHPATLTVAPLLDQLPTLFAGLGGEDYELLVTMPPTWNNPGEFEAMTGTRITPIGTVVVLPGVHLSLHSKPVQATGFVHRV